MHKEEENHRVVCRALGMGMATPNAFFAPSARQHLAVLKKNRIFASQNTTNRYYGIERIT